MYGSVRGVPGNRHSYRDKIISWLFNFTLTPFICEGFRAEPKKSGGGNSKIRKKRHGSPVGCANACYPAQSYGVHSFFYLSFRATIRSRLLSPITLGFLAKALNAF